MKHCIDDGTLQAWFDGELDTDAAAIVAAHTNQCAVCAQAARDLEVESSMVSQALAAEFGQTIPTESLRQRLDAAVAGLPPARLQTTATTNWIDKVRELFRPRVFAYASMVAAIALAAFLGFVYLKGRPSVPVAANQPALEAAPSTPAPSSELVATEPKPSPPVPAESPKRLKTRNPGMVAPGGTPLQQQESKYENTIATLDAAIKSKSPMRPFLQVEYEHNLALVDHAIAETRDAARKNPKDPQAAQFMAAAYQSKIDLMNQVADARTTDR
jgi:hypothetical protein